MMYPLVRELAADGVPVTVTCRVLNIARQPYYRWLASPVTDAELAAAYRANALFDAHRDDPEFGYRFLVDEAKEAGEAMAERTAWRICSELGMWSSHGKKRGKNGKKPGPPVHEDLCAFVDKHGVTRHEFKADSPNELWLGDITEHWTAEGKLYVCAIKDVYSNRIVGYSIDSRMKSRLAVAALNNAVARRGDVAGCVLHTDRGSQGGFNWSSQHLDDGGGMWVLENARSRSGSTGARSCRQDGRRSHGVRTASGSGRRSPAGSRPRTPASRRACLVRWGSVGSATLAA